MPFYKNVASQKIAVFAWDTNADEEKTGDAANITAQISKDGAATAATNDVNPTELDATDAPGIYLFDMTQAETNADLVLLFAKSATSDIKMEPVSIYTDTLVSVDNIADGVWDEDLTGHTTADTGGKVLSDVPDADAIADGVWDEDLTGHTTADTGGKILSDVPAASANADAVWDQDLTGHTDADSAGLKVGNLPQGFKKNTAFDNFMLLMIDSTDDKTGKTGLTVTASRSIDGASFAACANSVSEVGSGWYKINLAATDVNGDLIVLKFSASGANDTSYTLKTED